MEGTPKRVTHVDTIALATISAVLSAIGIASGHHVKQLIQVKTSTQPVWANEIDVNMVKPSIWSGESVEWYGGK